MAALPDDTARCTSRTTLRTTKILFHARRPRIRAHRHICRETGRACLLGSMVSGSSSHDVSTRCRNSHISHCHRLGKQRYSGRKSPSTRCLDDSATRTRHCQRPSGCDSQSRWPRTGSFARDQWHHLWGSSFVCGPQGEFLFRAPDNAEAEAIIDIDIQRSENVRRWWPFLRDRRIDAYTGIVQRFLD